MTIKVNKASPAAVFAAKIMAPQVGLLVKLCAGMSLDAAYVGQRGFQGFRRGAD